jgi:ribose transport system substrate-binding protein
MSRPISGLGPHGEVAASPGQLRLSPEASAIAAERRYRVAVVVHTGRSDWSKLQIAGIRAALDAVGADIGRVIECGFASDTQVAALQDLLDERPDAVISIPVDSLRSADVHRRLAESEIKLVLMDNAPVGMVAQKDYVTVVSADNFGNGEVAAGVLQGHVPQGGHVVVLGYGADFPVTNERELGFRKAMSEQRPDVRIDRVKFNAPERAGEVVAAVVTVASQPDALFVVWDEPAILASQALRAKGIEIPIATVDLGLDAAIEIAGGGPIIGGGAQLPYDQGYAEATAAIMALAGDRPPPWVALPALAVTRDNVLESYQAVWHDDPPQELIRALHRRHA